MVKTLALISAAPQQVDVGPLARWTSAMTTGRPFISTRQTHARIWWALSLMVLWTFSWVIGGTRISLATEHRNKVRPSREGPVWQVDVKATGWAKFTTRHGPR